jgi:dynein heavy chain 1
MARGSFENPERNYLLILDCKLKSETIENFNTLLDDSKLLSLSNGTRLKIHNNFKLIMETPDLEMTSPATITRCNVIYVSEQDVSKHSLLRGLLPLFNCA